MHLQFLLQGSDAASGVTLGYSGTTAGNLAGAGVGTYTITPSALVLSSGSTSNYTITYNTGTLTVNPAALTVTATMSNGGARISRSVIIGRVVRVIRHIITLALQFLDRSLQLRDRGRDIRQLDDIGFRLQRELAEFGEFIIHLLLGLQLIREIGQDTARQRNILERHFYAGHADKGLDDGQQGIGRQRWRFIHLGPDDFEFCARLLR